MGLLECLEYVCRVVGRVVSLVVSLVVSCRVVSCRVVSCRVVSCRVVSCRVVSCRVFRGADDWCGTQPGTHTHTHTHTDRTQNDTKIQNWHAYTTDSIFFVHGGVSERKVVDQRFGHNLTSNFIRVDLIITDFPFTRYLTPVCGGACACVCARARVCVCVCVCVRWCVCGVSSWINGGRARGGCTGGGPEFGRLIELGQNRTVHELLNGPLRLVEHLPACAGACAVSVCAVVRVHVCVCGCACGQEIMNITGTCPLPSTTRGRNVLGGVVQLGLHIPPHRDIHVDLLGRLLLGVCGGARRVSCRVRWLVRVVSCEQEKEGEGAYRGHEGGVDVLGRLFDRVHGTLLHGIGEQIPGGHAPSVGG